MSTQEPVGPAHIETGPTYRLPCWCDLGKDHTFEEWVEAQDD